MARPSTQEMVVLTREQRLEKINAFFTQAWMDPWTLDDLGDNAKGQKEAIAIKNITRAAGGEVKIIFLMRHADGLIVDEEQSFKIPSLRLSRKERLDQINECLTKAGLPEWTIVDLGDKSKGEKETIAVHNTERCGNELKVTFLVLHADGLLVEEERSLAIPNARPLTNPIQKAVQSGVLEKINSILAMHDLPKWDRKRLGSNHNGEDEIIAAESFRMISDGRMAITVEVRRPDATTYWKEIFFGGALICIVPWVTFSGTGQHTGSKVALISRWRTEQGCWSLEIPHGLEHSEEDNEVARALDSPVHRVMIRQFGNEFMEAVSATKPHRTGSITVTNENRRADSYLFVTNVLREIVRRRVDQKIVLATWPEIFTAIDNETIHDANSVAVLLQTHRRFEKSLFNTRADPQPE